MHMQLIHPSSLYKESFIQAVKEYQAEPSEYRRDFLDLDTTWLEQHFDEYVSRVLGQAEGKNLPEGFVPQTTLWLADNGEFIGSISIRHSLTEHLRREGGHIGYDIRPSKRRMGYGKKLLALALPEAKALGFTEVLLTCNADNTGSKKIIEANGGVFENSIAVHDGKQTKLRYHITL